MKSLPVAALTASCAFALSAAVSPLIDETLVISTADDRYCGWPTVSSTGPNELTVAFSGNRDGHVCPWGQVRRVKSTDGGRTWAKSEILENGPLDDRDAAILRLQNGDLILSWITSRAFYDFYLQGLHKQMGHLKNLKVDYARHFEKLPPDLVKEALGSFTRRSTDGGKTWEEKVRVPNMTFTPHGPIQLKDGRLMFVGEGRRVAVSTDMGRSWSILSSIPPEPASTPEQRTCFTEPALLEGADGTLRCYIRNHSVALCSESKDGGKTWSAPAFTKIRSWGSPMHLLRLKDGRFLLSSARRNDYPGCVFVLIGDENGTPESFGAANEIVFLEREGQDFGYTTTAQNDDGSLVTVYYGTQGADKDQNSVLHAARWHLQK